ncbi:hypothetical protein FACS1894111_05120 [Clostridia bacterium]|nr:hypothetical protein FACS1894111_05120 [Clostridia bacterium]
MPIRLAGLTSGMDTDSIVKQLVSAYSAKKQTFVAQNTTLDWKKDIWKDLNTKINKLYSQTTSSLRFSTAYAKKTTAVSDTNKVKVTAGSNALNGVQSLEIKELAQTGYLTGAKFTKADGGKVTGSTTLAELGLGGGGVISVGVGGKTTDVVIDKDETITNLVGRLKDAGVSANFDEANQRVFISAKESGKDADFTLVGSDGNGIDALNKLGLNASPDTNALLQKYGVKDTGGNYDQALTANSIAGILADIEQRKTENAGLRADNTAITDEIRYLGALKEYATAYKSIEEDAGWNNLDSSKQAALKNYLTMSKSEIDGLDEAEKANREAAIADLKTEGGWDDKAFAELKKNILTVDKYDSDVTAHASVQNVGNSDKDDLLAALTSDKLAALVSGADVTTEFDAFLADKADRVISLNADKQINDGAIAQNNAENNKYSDIAAFSGSTDLTATANSIATAIVSGDVSTLYNTGATKINGSDAKIMLNGAEFTSVSNTITVNGLTITALDKTEENKPITITTATDVQGMYDTMKNFIKEYNALVSEMNVLLHAPSAKGYQPLSDEDKEKLSEKEIEKWEQKIKDSLLRRDDNLSTLIGSMTSPMSGTYEVDGKKYTLASFGVSTSAYLLTNAGNANSYHIDGDADDELTSGKANKLMEALQNDPNTVTGFFQKMAGGLYDSLSKQMRSSTLRSTFTVYNDKQMDNDIKANKEKITKWEEKIQKIEDRYYKQFAAMESALAKLQSSTSSLSSMLGN